MKKAFMNMLLLQTAQKKTNGALKATRRRILDKLGFHDTSIPVSQLSGGQKKKVALAASLLANCDILVLDEPTNHLDNDMTEYLETYLNNYKGALGHGYARPVIFLTASQTGLSKSTMDTFTAMIPIMKAILC